MQVTKLTHFFKLVRWDFIVLIFTFADISLLLHKIITNIQSYLLRRYNFFCFIKNLSYIKMFQINVLNLTDLSTSWTMTLCDEQCMKKYTKFSLSL
jgi:hypothetical protein